MPRKQSLWILTPAVAAALFLSYVVYALTLSPSHIDNADFLPADAAAHLVTQGRIHDIYNRAAVVQVEHSVLDQSGCVEHGCQDLEYHWMPGAALVATVLTPFNYLAAFRVWVVLQLALLLTATVVAVRSAPWRQGVGRSQKVVAGFAGLAGAGTFFHVSGGQADGFTVLGLALAMAWWDRHPARAGAALAIGALIAKPNPLLGVFIFALLIGLRRPKLLLSLAGVSAAIGVVWFALIGAGGWSDFLGLVSNTQAQLQWDVNISSITSLFGAGSSAQLSYILDVIPLAVIVILGLRSPRDATHRAWIMVCVVFLSVLGSPHDYWQDLVVLLPAAIWWFALTTTNRGGAAPPVWNTDIAGWMGASLLTIAFYIYVPAAGVVAAACVLTVGTAAVVTRAMVTMRAR
jgi:Glycosyltransferase family 87